MMKVPVVLLGCGVWLAGMLCPDHASAQDVPAESSAVTLKKMSVEELMNVEVTLVSKRPEKLTESPSAIQVITGEDIRRSGALSLPEALRLATNLQVAQTNAHDWAITARGFNGAPLSTSTLADKLLVMIDGRSVYTPLFGGVFWDVQNVLLEDVDRIEVVSGPGGTLWGANAVNGVINIVTKRAKDTQGLYGSAGWGSVLQDAGAVRYGGHVGSQLYYRVYGQRFERNSTQHGDGSDAQDAWSLSQGGLRVDYTASHADHVTIQGDGYGGREGMPTNVRMDGNNVLGRWTHTITEASDLQVQVYADRTWRNLSTSSFRDKLHTYDLDIQHRFPLGDRHAILWGTGYRAMQNVIHNVATFAFVPARRTMQLWNGFVQDEIAVLPNRLAFTVGTKVEHNVFSGTDVQPSARLAWTVARKQVLWAAVSRAVRSPTRLDVEVQSPVLATPNHRFDSEKVTAYELGYRTRPVDRVSLSFATFYNRYRDLRSIDTNPSPPPPYIFANGQRATSWGGEALATVQAADWWRVRAGYTHLEKRMRATLPGVVASSETIEGNDPRNQGLLHSIMDLPAGVQWDVVARFVGSLPSPSIKQYVDADSRLAWQGRRFEVAVIGQNLWRARHPEFTPFNVRRNVYAMITMRQ